MNATCPTCEQAGILVPAGVSKVTGHQYGAFYRCASCRDPGQHPNDAAAGVRHQAWKSQRQWEYQRAQAVAGAARRAEEVAAAAKSERRRISQRQYELKLSVEKAFYAMAQPERAQLLRRCNVAPHPLSPSGGVLPELRSDEVNALATDLGLHGDCGTGKP
jgi:hypothetical protein